MSMDPISRLNEALRGRYRVERELGEGGMATVYLADDLKHERKVALKVLKPALAAVVGGERFLAEIKTTANLQHPHILPLFDSGEADGFLFYVMPYVEGESLRNRLDRERQLGVDEAVRIATNVAEALDYAHRQGVIHRDIKPANILLQDGKPVLSDFGIALAVTAAGGGRLTETGLSLGTPHYMSPEQATADRTPDARSDLYSLGCVLYEMLVGEPPFTGGSAQAVLGKIITAPPPEAGRQRKGVPPHVEATILWALEKLPADRVGSGKAFVEALSGNAHVPVALRAASRAGSPVRWGERVAWGTTVALVGVVSALLFRTPGDRALRRLDLALSDSIPMAFIGEAALGNGRRAFDITSDGSRLVYVGLRDGTPRLYVRSLDDYEAEELPGTEGAYGPFFAPSGTQVAFFVGNELRKVRVDGGAVVTIAQAPNPVGGDWMPTGQIVFAGSEGRVLSRVSDQGGAVDTLGALRGDEFYWPQVLPGGDRILSTSFVKAVNVWDARTRTRRVLDLPQASQASYLPSGHIVLVRGSVLHVARFDAEALEVTSPFVAVQPGVRSEIYGRGQWDVSDDGTLVYAEGRSVTENDVLWVGPGMEPRSLGLRTASRGTFELSPADDRLAVVEEDASGSHVVVYDLDNRRPQRLSSEPGAHGALAWSPDGDELMYLRVTSRDEEDVWRVQLQPVNGGEARPLPTDRPNASGFSWSATGEIGMLAESGLALVSTTTGEERPIPATDDTSWGVVMSPAGDLIAYTSEQSGEYHNYVQPHPFTGEIAQVSLIGGAEEPRWSVDGSRLYYRSGQRIMFVSVERGPPLSVGTPQVFWEGDFVNVGGRSYDISSDDQRALVIDGGVGTTTRLRVIQGWLAEVERLIDEAAGSGR